MHYLTSARQPKDQLMTLSAGFDFESQKTSHERSRLLCKPS